MGLGYRDNTSEFKPTYVVRRWNPAAGKQEPHGRQFDTLTMREAHVQVAR
jgi:hypothetical protein